MRFRGKAERTTTRMRKRHAEEQRQTGRGRPGLKRRRHPRGGGTREHDDDENDEHDGDTARTATALQVFGDRSPERPCRFGHAPKGS